MRGEKAAVCLVIHVVLEIKKHSPQEAESVTQTGGRVVCLLI